MMDDVISRQAAMDAVDERLMANDYSNVALVSELNRLYGILARLPSAERHGRWEHLGGDEWFCSACGHVITTEGSWERPWQKYCEECGAKMMREDEEMSKVSEMEMAYAESLND